jgi:preprotein translocase SecF subunit
MLAILIFVWFRFTFRFGVTSVLALFHDVIITLGLLSLTGREMSIQIIAALLTLIGYSINDSIIVSDRIRENVKLMRKDSYDQIINKSLNQVLTRTIITSLTTLFVLVCLFLFGGSVINDFAFTLIAGIIVGTYSSDFVVAPLVLDWELKYHTRKRG